MSEKKDCLLRMCTKLLIINLNNFEQQALHHRKKFRLFPGGSYNEGVNTPEPSSADTTFNPLPHPVPFALLTQIVHILQITLLCVISQY